MEWMLSLLSGFFFLLFFPIASPAYRGTKNLRTNLLIEEHHGTVRIRILMFLRKGASCLEHKEIINVTTNL